MTDQMAIRLERSTLIVPASRPAMIAKAAMARADAVCIDCEDGFYTVCTHFTLQGFAF